MKKFSLFFLSAILILTGCAPGQNSNSTVSPSTSPAAEIKLYKGVSLSPKSFASQDFTEFMQTTSKIGNTLTWSGSIEEMTDEKKAPYTVTQLASIYNYEPIAIVHLAKSQNHELAKPLTAENTSRYQAGIVNFVSKYQPKYLGIGIEVNDLEHNSPEDFAEFVEFFNQTYDEIKKASPQTQVFTVFQLERMKGMRGGLFGEKNDPKKFAQWDLLQQFNKADLMAFTTYPCLIYKDPKEIPADYYSEIQNHITKPIIFTEVGWFHEGPRGWESTSEEQAEFIRLFFDLTKEVEPKVVIWSFVYDPESAAPPANKMGLLTKDQTTSPAFEAWREASY